MIEYILLGLWLAVDLLKCRGILYQYYNYCIIALQVEQNNGRVGEFGGIVFVVAASLCKCYVNTVLWFYTWISERVMSASKNCS